VAAKKRVVKKRVIPFKRKNGPPASSKPPAPTAVAEQESLLFPVQGDQGGLSLFPHQLRTGDRYTDASGKVWLVAGSPTGLRHGTVMVVRFRSADDLRGQWQQVWPAHERVRVRRAT
jgi:hypothetical protein